MPTTKFKYIFKLSIFSNSFFTLQVQKDGFDPTKVDFAPGSGALVIDGEEILTNDAIEVNEGRLHNRASLNKEIITKIVKKPLNYRDLWKCLV